VFVQAHAQFAFAQGADAGEQQAHEVHGVFPFDLAAGCFRTGTKVLQR
jgi:hypothetical protein